MAKNKEAKKKKLIEILGQSPIVEFACKSAGVGRSTYYRWRNEDVKFADKADEALDRGIDQINDLAEAKLIQLIKEGHVTGIIFWLKFRHPAYKRVFLAKSNIKEKPEFSLPIPQEIIDAADKVLAEENQEIITIDETTGERKENI